MVPLQPQRVRCIKCPLGESGSLPVEPDGPVGARIMFLGEAPGQREDETGRPFVGRAGNVLMELIESLGMERRYVLINNVTRCRPPGNRTPTYVEVETRTRHFYWPMLRKYRWLKLMVPLDKSATNFLLPGNRPILKTAGKVHHYLFGAYLAYPMVHPAATFRSGVYAKRWKADSERLAHLMYRDFFGVKDSYGTGRRIKKGPPRR